MFVDPFRHVRDDKFQVTDQGTVDAVWEASQSLLYQLATNGVNAVSHLGAEDQQYIDETGIDVGSYFDHVQLVTDKVSVVRGEIGVGTCPYVEPKIAATVRPDKTLAKTVKDHKGQIIVVDGVVVGMIKYFGEPVFLGLQTVADPDQNLPVIPLGLYATNLQKRIVAEGTPDTPGWVIRPVDELVLEPERVATFDGTQPYEFSTAAFSKVESGLDRLIDEAQEAYDILVDGGEPAGEFYLLAQ